MENLAAEISHINLLLDQGEVDRARHQAQEVLLLHPNSAVIHALMGDIAAARREAREAIDWYELSLRLERNPAVQSRLDRQREQLERQAETEIDQLLAPPPNRQRVLVLGLIGGLVVLGILIAIIAGVRASRGGERRTGGRATPSRPASRTGAPGAPVAGLPGTGPATYPAPAIGGRPAVSAAPRPSVGTPAPPTIGGAVRITESIEAPLSDRDRLLGQALSGITWGTGEQLGWRVMALVDDFTGYALLNVEVPPGVQRVDLSGTVTDMAYRLAVAAIQADSGVQSLTVRVTVQVEANDRNAMLLAFRANTTRDHLDYYLKRGIQPDRQTIWDHVFATAWWNPSVPSGQEASQ